MNSDIYEINFQRACQLAFHQLNSIQDKFILKNVIDFEVFREDLRSIYRQALLLRREFPSDFSEKFGSHVLSLTTRLYMTSNYEMTTVSFLERLGTLQTMLIYKIVHLEKEINNVGKGT